MTSPSPKRSILLAALSVLVLPQATVWAAIDGEKAKKQEEAPRPQLSGEDVQNSEDAHAKEHDRLIRTGQENLKEIQRLLNEAQDGLRGQQTGTPTQKRQAKAVEKMNLLIKELGKGCKQCAAGGSGSKSKKPGGGQKKKGQGKKEQQKQKQIARQKQKKMQAKQQKPSPSENEKKDGETENNQTDRTDVPDNRYGKIGDGLHQFERWGVLPPKMVEEMLSSSGKEGPPEYREIISRYYKRIIDSYQRRGRR
jgi:hypothetical protein